MKKLLFAIFLLAAFSCSDQRSFEQPVAEQTANDEVSVGIRLVNGKWSLNEEVIIKNQNLDHLISLLEQTAITNYITPTALPPFIRSFFKDLNGADFSLASPGENWQSGCVVLEDLPKRQMTYLGLGNDLVLMSYKTGGIGVSQHILIIQFKGQQVTDLWTGIAMEELPTKVSILNFIKKNRNKKWGFNNGGVYL
jgi:hypothetical protein